MKDYNDLVRRSIRKDFAKANFKRNGRIPKTPHPKHTHLSVDDFAAEYMGVIAGVSKRPFAERGYIQQLGQQAYNLTVAQYVVEEYPELEPVLIPKAKAN